MTFKAYLVNIEKQTGLSPEEFYAMAKKKGFIVENKVVAKHSELLAWLKSEIGLGHGHAYAMVLYLRLKTNDPKAQKSKGKIS